MPDSRFRFVSTSVILALFFVLIPFRASGQNSAHEHPSPSPVKRAIAVLQPTKGNSVHGTVTYEMIDHGVRVTVDISGLTPGKHGFHIHEFGDCSADDASSAGGHFNPAGASHGAPTAGMRHAGDMGNIEADKDGRAMLDYVDHVMTLSGERSILGHAVIVHEKEDDLKSQPTGNAGGRTRTADLRIMRPSL